MNARGTKWSPNNKKENKIEAVNNEYIKKIKK